MIKFNKNNGTIEPFTIILSNRNQEHLGEIVNTEAVNYTGNFNSADELSFTVHKFVNGQEERLWDDIYDLRLVYIKELNEYFEINVSFVDQTYLVKTITAKSLCEAELSQTMLYDIEINTEIDIDREDYKVAKFWTNVTDPESEEYKSTILYRVLEKVPAYTVKHVDATLVDLQRVFSIDNKSVYDWLISDCATEFNCLVKFDSTDRTISFYDLYTTCPVCHSRGLYNDFCTHIITQDDMDKYGHNGLMPNGKQVGETCGNTENLGYYGEDTTILVSTENLTDEIHYETDVDSIKNSFRLEAGDDDMTAAIVNINPNGSQYINVYSPESLKDMPEELVDAIEEYNKLYNYYKYTAPYAPANISTYNALVNKYKTAYEHAHDDETTLNTLPSSLVGYAKLMEAIYQCFDFYSYLESSMMPKIDPPHPTAQSEADKISQGMGTEVALTSFNRSTTTATVNSALVNYAKVLVYTGFVKVEVDEAYSEFTNNGQSGTWVGRFIVTDYSLEDTDREKTAYTSTLTLNVTDNYDKFIEQKIRKKIAKDEGESYELQSLLMEDDLATFTTNMKKYSANRLRSFKDSIEAVLGVMQEANIALDPAQQKDVIRKQLYNQFYYPFLLKFRACENEFNLRNTELEVIAKYVGGAMTSGIMFDMLDYKEEVNDTLDFKKFLDKKSEEYNDQKTYKEINPDSPFYMDTAGRFVTYGGRGYNKSNDGLAYCGAFYSSTNNWTYPILVSTNPDAVRYTTTSGGGWDYIGTVEFHNQTWYYNGGYYAFGGNQSVTPTDRKFSGAFPTIEEAALALLNEATVIPVDPMDFYKLLSTYTRQDTYSNSNYISTSLNNEDLFTMAQLFYDAAYEELLKASTYQHSITANLYNLLAMDEFKPLQNKFELGNWLRVQTDDNTYRLRLISYSVNFDDPTYLDTQFSDVTQTGDGYNDLQSLLNQANSMATSFPAVTRQAELGKLAHTGMGEWLKTGLNSAKTRIMNNDAEEIEITNVGITAKTYNDITETYDDEQLRITHNILAFTDDNWETVKTALGKFTFTYFEPHTSDTTEHRKEAYGLVAEAVLAGWVVGSTLEGNTIIGGHIQNPGNSTYIDMYNDIWSDREHTYKDFIHYDDGLHTFRIDKSGNIITRGGHISEVNNNYYIDLEPYQEFPDGTNVYYDYFLYIRDTFMVTKRDGTIISKSGHFQNQADTSYIDLGEGSRYSVNQGQVVNEPYFLRCKQPSIFSVSKEGYLIATSGQIGGFYISDNYISSTRNLSDSNNNDVSLSTSTFSRELYQSVASVDPETGTITGYTSNKGSTSNLKFAIGDKFGVSTDGIIYGQYLHVAGIETAVLSCNDLVVKHNMTVGNNNSIININGNSVTIDSTANPTHIESLYINGHEMYATDGGDLLDDEIQVQGVHMLDEDLYIYSGNTKVYPAWIWTGDSTMAEGQTLREGFIYLELE